MKKIFSKLLLSLITCLLLVNTYFVNNISAKNNKYNFNSDYSQASVINGYSPVYGGNNFTYDESWFENPSYGYNHDLAKLQLVMSLASAREYYITEMFDQLGYSYINNDSVDLVDTTDTIVFVDTFANYDLYDAEKDTIGYSFGYKNVQLENGEIYTIIAIAIRSTNYGTEWSSNFTLGTEGDSYGFSQAATTVKNRIVDFINEIDSPYPIKITIAGYSRGSAVTNMLGHYLNQEAISNENLNLKPENIYSYGFEVPKTGCNVTKTDYSFGYNNVSLDDNLFSIVNEVDLVTKIPMKQLGFEYYGVTVNMPSTMTLADFYNSEYYQNMYDEYEIILGEDPSDKLTFMQNQIATLENIVYTLSWAFDNSRDLYVSSDGQILGRYLGLSVLDRGCSLTKAKLYYYNSSGERKEKAEFDLSEIFNEGVNASLIWEMLSALTFWTYEKSYELEVYTDYQLYDHASVKISKDKMKEIRSLAYDVYQLYDDGRIDLSNLMSLILGHYPELCISWMNTIDDSILNQIKRYHTITIDSDTTVSIYYQDNLVGQVSNDSVTKIENSIEAYITDDEKLVIKVPSQDGYKVVLSYDSKTSLNVSVNTTNINTNQTTASYNYQVSKANGNYNIVLSKDNCVLLDNNGQIVQTTSFENYKDETDVSLTINYNDKQGSVTGSGTYYRNQLVDLTATADADYDFDGWYLDNELISEEESFTFLIDSDKTLEARFVLSEEKVLKNHVSFNDVTFGTGLNNVYTVSGKIDELFRSDMTLTYKFKNKEYVIETEQEEFSFDISVANSDINETIDVYVVYNDVQSEHLVIDLDNFKAKVVVNADSKQGSVTGGGTYKLNKTITLKANPTADYDFVGYYDGNKLISNSATTKLLVDCNKQLTAKFVLSETKVLNNYVSFDVPTFYATNSNGFRFTGKITGPYKDDMVLHYTFNGIDHIVNTTQENFSFDVDVDLNEINQKIDVYVVYNDVQSEHLIVDVDSYYNQIKNNNKVDSKTKGVLESLVEYQKYQQDYFNDQQSSINLNHLDKDDVSQYAYKVNDIGDDQLIKLTDATLILDDDLSLRIYYNINKNYHYNQFNYQIDDKDVGSNVVITDQYIQINDIRDIFHSYHVEISNESTVVDFNYSVASYIYEILRMKDNSYNSIKNLAIAVYDYGNALNNCNQK